MPVYNAEQYLVEAIESIRNQTYTHWELIAVDDCSTDSSWKILQSYARKDKRIKIFRLKQNYGPARGLNLAIKKARGYYLARMDADDISLPQRLARQVVYLKENPQYIAIGTQMELINEKGDVFGYKYSSSNPKELYRALFTMAAIQHPTLMTYTSLMKKNNYDIVPTAEDTGMFFRLLSKGKFSNTEEILFQYRIRRNSNSFKDPKKTFYYTLKARIHAVLKEGYRPSLKGILINCMQSAVVTILPTRAIIYLFEQMRYKRLTPAVMMQEAFSFAWAKVKTILML